eukprot:1159401-Pelagomonas_calceolata.AAC.5
MKERASNAVAKLLALICLGRGGPSHGDDQAVGRLRANKERTKLMCRRLCREVCTLCRDITPSGQSTGVLS